LTAMSFQGNLKNRRNPLLASVDSIQRSVILFSFISLIVHGLLFVGLIFFQDFSMPKPLPSVIQIDLVSFAPEPLLAEPAKSVEDTKDEGIPVKAEPIKKTTRKIPSIKPEISLKTKPKNLKDLKAKQQKKKKVLEKKKEKKPIEKEKPKQIQDPDKTLEKARQEIEKKVEKQSQDKIEQALSRLQKKVREQGGAKTGTAKGTYAGAGKKGYKPIDLYNLVIGSTIEQNWVFNDILARMDQRLEVIILIKVLKSGEIRDIIYETRSGNRYLDESAKKAVMKANPLPALPAGMRSYDFGLVFTPKGLK